MVGLVIGVLIALVIIAFIIVTYNKLVRLNNKVKNAFAQIETQLQRRFDLIPNLVETVKGYKIHEQEVLESVAASRSGFLNADTNQEKLQLYNELNTNLRKLFAVTEAYPDLKANASFLMLQQELAGTEDKLTYARQFYNDAVTMYNDAILVFPNNFVAAIFGMGAEKLFDAEEAADKAPAVRF